MLRRTILQGVALSALLLAVPALAQDSRPLV